LPPLAHAEVSWRTSWVDTRRLQPRRAVPCSGRRAPYSEPIKTWRNKAEFAEVAGRLVNMFRENFKRFESQAEERVRDAGPNPRMALT
jgi:ATP-dependent phosphoenolpyruvate carboxykinase